MLYAKYSFHVLSDYDLRSFPARWLAMEILVSFDCACNTTNALINLIKNIKEKSRWDDDECWQTSALMPTRIIILHPSLSRKWCFISKAWRKLTCRIMMLLVIKFFYLHVNTINLAVLPFNLRPHIYCHILQIANHGRHLLHILLHFILTSVMCDPGEKTEEMTEKSIPNMQPTKIYLSSHLFPFLTLTYAIAPSAHNQKK